MIPTVTAPKSTRRSPRPSSRRRVCFPWHDDDSEGDPMIGTRAGRILSAVGATALIAGLFLTWYHIDRAVGPTDTTGWQTFTRLRWLILLGAVVLLVTAVVRQTRAVLLARFFLGVVLGALILRRIIDPPNIANIS